MPPAYVQGSAQTYNQQFDWRYQRSQPQYGRPHDPFAGTGPRPLPGGTGVGPIPVVPDKALSVAARAPAR
ncbi:hypothetical protein NIIDMKKI_11060 [Mycobacterium kansasii]|uniref:Uncharacterized protein n=1 Tax=Mycobacterium kansasii TaxID=1768 RepID=A0A7G1I4G3_MYCKA|nr:hypothetical protein NIIDMKKI_11060 [Mycobacterium kansasii]